MKVVRAKYLGYCFGVEAAIRAAERATRAHGTVYSLGPLIHNTQAVERLIDSGLKVVDKVDELGNAPVLIRAHGLSPQTTLELQGKCSEVINATCILVRRAQDAVKSLHEQGYTVVVVGDEKHPEVQGIMGYAPDVVVISGPDELDKLPAHGKIGIVAQTTLSQERFAATVGKLATCRFLEIKMVNTLCGEVERRLTAAAELALRVDVMFVLGGLHSANTRKLAEICRKQGVPTYHLEDWRSFRDEYVWNRNIAGVTAGTSTPLWIVSEFVEHLEQLTLAEASKGYGQSCYQGG